MLGSVIGNAIGMAAGNAKKRQSFQEWRMAFYDRDGFVWGIRKDGSSSSRTCLGCGSTVIKNGKCAHCGGPR